MDLQSLHSLSWNTYRYVGDYLHDAAVILLVGHVFCRRSVAGFSRRTQSLYLVLYIARYLDLLDHSQHTYLVAHKLFFIGTAATTLCAFCLWSQTYQKQSDTCPAFLLALVTLFLSPWVAAEGDVLEIMWTWSQILEGFAMVPQYICSYRNSWDGQKDDCGVATYICFMGFYRIFYILNWMHKKARFFHYWDPHSWLGGAVNLCFFADYLLFLAVGISCLRRVTLSLDDGVHQVGDELRDRFGGCLLSPGQRYLDIGPVADLELRGQPERQDGVLPATLGAQSEPRGPAE